MASVKGGLVASQQKNATVSKQNQGLKNLIITMLPQIEKALPKVMTPERFSRIALTAVSNNPQLAQCSPKSFLGAMMQAAQLGLEPNTPLGQAYLIPYRDKNRGLEAQFQLGYKGLIDLAYRSGEVKDIQAHEVYENDEFEYELGLEPKLKHKPALVNRGKVILYYAVFHTKSGGYGFEVMSVEDIKAHAQKYSKAINKDSSPWKNNFDSMAKKTVLKSCLKYAPIKTEFIRQVGADETIKSNITSNMLDEHDETTIDMDISPETQENKETKNEPSTTSEVHENVDLETGEILQPEQPTLQEK